MIQSLEVSDLAIHSREQQDSHRSPIRSIGKSIMAISQTISSETKAKSKHPRLWISSGSLERQFRIYGRSIPLNARSRILIPAVLLVSLLAIAGCKKKGPPAPLPETAPPTSVPAPTAQITIAPTVISAGDQAVLTWHTTDASNVSIDGMGAVPTSGVRTVTPTTSTSYHLMATGAGGTTDATARVTVNSAPVVNVPSNTMSEEDAFKANVQDAFFDYDTYDIRGDAQAVLAKDASFLVSHPDIKVVIGGYCDERGSNEYNLALGQNRADSAKKALINAGVAASRIRVISYGKERPFCTESAEACWQQNRRAGFALDR